MKAPRKKLSLPAASGAGQSAPEAARSENRKAFVRAGQQAVSFRAAGRGCGHKPFCSFFWCARNVPFQPLCSPRALRAGLIAQGIGANPGIVQVGYGRQCSCIEGISGGTLPPRLAGFCGQGTCIRSKASGGFHRQRFRYGTQAQAGFYRRASCFRARAAGPAEKGHADRTAVQSLNGSRPAAAVLPRACESAHSRAVEGVRLKGKASFPRPHGRPCSRCLSGPAHAAPPKGTAMRRAIRFSFFPQGRRACAALAAI